MTRFIITTLGCFLSLLAIAQLPEEKLDNLFSSVIGSKQVPNGVISIHQGGSTWTKAHGELSQESQYFIASITKLYTTTIILQLREEGKLQLDHPIANYLPKDVIDHLHVYNGVDYSSFITIRQLLSQTSGLPDYFEDSKKGSPPFVEELKTGHDRKISFEETIALSKTLKPPFKPGTSGKAHYSDTNYQLLGKIIERLTEKSLSEIFENQIFNPLELKKTYIYCDTSDQRPVLFRNEGIPLDIPLAMSSFVPDGGIVSTAEESFIFLQAFISGKLFPKSYIAEMQQWNKIFFPFKYGTGLMLFEVPGGGGNKLIGHNGLCGSFAFYNTHKDVYITGTINQLDNPQKLYKVLIKMLSVIE